MRRIHPDLDSLQPVAVQEALEREDVTGRCHQAIERRQRRRQAVAEEGEHQAAALHHRVALLAHPAAHRALRRLARSLQALAGGIEQPAVKQAAQAAILQASERKVSAAVRAIPVQQPQAAVPGPEQHQVLAHDPYRLDRTWSRQLLRQGNRLPVPAQQLPRRSTRPHPRQ